MSENSSNRVQQCGDKWHISFEDQQRIIQFSKHNSHLDDFKVELEMKRNELKSLQEALEELELFHEKDEIPFLVGEAFIVHKLGQAQQLLAETRDKVQKEISSIEAKTKISKLEMDKLEAHFHRRG